MDKIQLGQKIFGGKDWSVFILTLLNFLDLGSGSMCILEFLRFFILLIVVLIIIFFKFIPVFCFQFCNTFRFRLPTRAVRLLIFQSCSRVIKLIQRGPTVSRLRILGWQRYSLLLHFFMILTILAQFYLLLNFLLLHEFELTLSFISLRLLLLLNHLLSLLLFFKLSLLCFFPHCRFPCLFLFHLFDLLSFG